MLRVYVLYVEDERGSSVPERSTEWLRGRPAPLGLVGVNYPPEQPKDFTQKCTKRSRPAVYQESVTSFFVYTKDYGVPWIHLVSCVHRLSKEVICCTVSVDECGSLAVQVMAQDSPCLEK